jgi:N-acetylglucosaminyl-diphospho-decaprenol L-rhamnosyltransferase
MTARLAIILVNFRTPKQTIECVASLEPEVAANPGTRVVVVENGSGDDSAAVIGREIDDRGWKSWCTLLVAERNWGFAGGNARGIELVQREGSAAYYLLLNSDTIVHAGCLSYCLGVMDRDSTIGAMSCRLLNTDGTVQNTCRKFPTPARCIAGALGLTWKLPRLFGWADCDDPGWDRNTVKRDVDWIGGAFVLVRGDYVDTHGAFDEAFFFYGEDIEFSHGVWRRGLRVHYDPGATITHLGGASSDPTKINHTAKGIHAAKGRNLVQRKCYGRFAELLVWTVDLINIWLRAAIYRVRSGKASEGYLRYKGALGILIQSRKT